MGALEREDGRGAAECFVEETGRVCVCVCPTSEGRASCRRALGRS